RHGRITLDVPLSGRIDDPKFRAGPIIWQVVMNLIEKAATSPFSLLGAMFGGGDELSFVAFQPGLATIPDTETNKLNTLTKALYERPELTLEINGSVDPELDRAPLAKMKFDQQIKSLYVKELTDSGKPAVAIDQVQLEPKERDRLVKRDYKLVLGKYQPSPPPTNNLLTSADMAATSQGNKGLVQRLATELPEHGASLLMEQAKPIKIVSTSKIAAGTNGKPAVPLTAAEILIADMETQLVQKIEITDDDLRELMKQRAAKVQAYLLQDGKITAERLFITAPKPIGGSEKGTDRVNMTLD
ncbi:MAG TPA: hypothetical protein VG754_12485, partial [Verrucomicrobiae bacterium]|nr:hypothetical protein [Verrucomicrobiae bacterium]